MGYDVRDIEMLRKRAENNEKIYMNKKYKDAFDIKVDSNDDRISGVGIRCVICLCLFAAFMAAGFHQDGMLLTSKLEQKISENQLLNEAKQSLEDIKEVFRNIAE